LCRVNAALNPRGGDDRFGSVPVYFSSTNLLQCRAAITQGGCKLRRSFGVGAYHGKASNVGSGYGKKHSEQTPHQQLLG